jgi:hypothetical protein
MHKYDRSVTLFALCIVVGLLLPSGARSDDKNSLVQDIRAYLNRCQSQKKSSASKASDPCVKDKAELIRRQHDLKLSNADVNTQLAKEDEELGIRPRGGLHGGAPYYWP